jgi:hypothetical protein
VVPELGPKAQSEPAAISPTERFAHASASRCNRSSVSISFSSAASSRPGSPSDRHSARPSAAIASVAAPAAVKNVESGTSSFRPRTGASM